MDRPSDSQTQPPASKQEEAPVKIAPPSYRSLYLIFYNAISAFLWSVVLGRVLAIVALHGTRNVYVGVGQWTQWTQTLAALEVMHSAVGTYGSWFASSRMLSWQRDVIVRTSS
jgi:very-long-chain (3R)-3-hydroxyacyl-CoA dehydratase